MLVKSLLSSISLPELLVEIYINEITCKITKYIKSSELKEFMDTRKKSILRREIHNCTTISHDKDGISHFIIKFDNMLYKIVTCETDEAMAQGVYKYECCVFQCDKYGEMLIKEEDHIIFTIYGNSKESLLFACCFDFDYIVKIAKEQYGKGLATQSDFLFVCAKHFVP